MLSIGSVQRLLIVTAHNEQMPCLPSMWTVPYPLQFQGGISTYPADESMMNVILDQTLLQTILPSPQSTAAFPSRSL